MIFTSCGSDGGDDPEPEPEPEPEGTTITVNPTDIKQEMVGFGGALTWYSTWMTGNNKKEEIADLVFDDLGIDIIRFKTWYYPDNYPTNKSIDVMGNTADNDYAKSHWDATNELYEMAMDRNPDIKILLSSWGPPISLKDNGNLKEGTLKKDGSAFMYDAFATYWEDILDNVPFDPDYISIQNEPTYSNAGWTTCKWAASETSTLPSYMTAFDKVYDKVKIRTHKPIMLGPESQDISTFVSFANALKDNPNCGMLGFHPYNINTGTFASVNIELQKVGNFNTKPNIMTEFADNVDWYNTALFIHHSLVTANTSGYIYWKLVWDGPASGEDAGIISVESNPTSAYKVTPYYHLLKHYAKYVDAGYDRVTTTSTNSLLLTTAFLSPDSKKLTLVIINNGSTADDVKLSATGKTATGINVFQSKSGDYYKTVTVASPTAAVNLPAKSITTVVLDI
ncbi:MAG TPA: glycoside hydrolase family 30 beta sandwich domain-containing protein [Ohtaekwangia sp.]